MQAACGFATLSVSLSHHASPPARTDPLQPHGVCVAVCAVGGGDGVGGQSAIRSAGGVSLARFAGHFGVHGLRPQRGDGLQPAGRPAARRAESANANAALAHGRSFHRQRRAVYGRLLAGFRGVHAAVSAAQPDSALRRRCRCWRFCSDTALRSGSRCCRIFGWGRR